MKAHALGRESKRGPLSTLPILITAINCSRPWMKYIKTTYNVRVPSIENIFKFITEIFALTPLPLQETPK